MTTTYRLDFQLFLLRWSFKEYAYDDTRSLSLDPSILRSDDPILLEQKPRSVVVVEAVPVEFGIDSNVMEMENMGNRRQASMPSGAPV